MGKCVVGMNMLSHNALIVRPNVYAQKEEMSLFS